MVKRYALLESLSGRKKLANEYFENQIGYHDSDISGTKTRVYSALRIISADQVEFALGEVISGNNRVSSEAKREAAKSLEKIKDGTLCLPTLNK